ncbi:MAG: ribonuclease III [Clostridiales bacterium]|jgi:ribonuclease-3|nr:ribonuclease III [Clostridiales bacterium]
MEIKHINEISKKFNDSSLFKQALTHSSYAYEKGLDNAHNERLEFLGDAVLELIISEMLYKRFPDFTEGQLTKLRANLVCEQNLAKLARELTIQDSLKLGKGEESTGGRNRDALLADAFEAVIGSLYLDNGLESVKEAAYLLFEDDIKTQSESFETTDFKTFLQEHLQKKSKNPINYVITNEHGPDHDKTFTSMVEHEGVILGKGKGKSKKESEQNAAAEAIQKLGLNR